MDSPPTCTTLHRPLNLSILPLQEDRKERCSTAWKILYSGHELPLELSCIILRCDHSKAIISCTSMGSQDSSYHLRRLGLM